MENKIRIGISSCLLGNNVRYNGGHQLDRLIISTLGEYVEFVPVCPEVECGLGIPRETMRLVGSPQNPRLVTTKSRIDHTERMIQWARKRVNDLESESLCGFIFKSRSPSSGMERVKVYHPDKPGVAGTASGMFARIFMDHFPLMPVEEDGRLHDIVLRETFIESIFIYKRYRDLIADKKKLGSLIAFHTDHKLQFMARSINHYRAMGKLVADAKSLPLEQFFQEYERGMLQALRIKSTIKKNVNVLQHMLGYFKKQLSSEEKTELLDLIENYRQGFIPLIVPITLFNHYVKKYKQEYLARQHYLNPHPIEMRLRNHA